MIKLNAQQTEHITVEISENELVSAICKHILHRNYLSADYYISLDGNLMEERNDWRRFDSIVRKATPADEEVYKLIRQIGAYA